MTYMDRTWCNDKTCGNDLCSRYLTDEHKDRANKLYNGNPIFSMGNLKDTELCEGYFNKKG